MPVFVLFCFAITKFCVQLPLSRRIKLIFNYLVGPLLFAGIGWSIYRQLMDQPQLATHWQHIQQVLQQGGYSYMVVAFLLMLVNWGLEGKKWHLLTSHVQQLSYTQALKSVISGISFTMLTPNRMGEFLGRVLYLSDGSRMRAATLTLLSSISQLVVTLLAGVVGLLLLKQAVPEVTMEAGNWTGLLMNALLYGSLFVMVMALLLFFNIGWLVTAIEKIPQVAKYAWLIHTISEIRYTELMKLLALSIVRYTVFLCQYWLVFRFFEVDMSTMQIVICTAVMFLLLAIVPTIALAELGIRGQVSLFVFGLFSQFSLEILVATAVIWFINIILPAITGSFLLLSVKIFKK